MVVCVNSIEERRKTGMIRVWEVMGWGGVGWVP